MVEISINPYTNASNRENRENHSIISATKPTLTVDVNTLNKNIVRTNTNVIIADTNWLSVRVETNKPTESKALPKRKYPK